MEFFRQEILEWVAISFSRGSSQPRDWNRVSCIAGRFFTIWATRKALFNKQEESLAERMLGGGWVRECLEPLFCLSSHQRRNHQPLVKMEGEMLKVWRETRSGNNTGKKKIHSNGNDFAEATWASPVAKTVKNLLAMQETWIWFLGWEDPLEEGMATHSSNLAWRIPMDRGAQQATVYGGHKELDMTEWLSTFPSTAFWFLKRLFSFTLWIKNISSLCVQCSPDVQG